MSKNIDNSGETDEQVVKQQYQEIIENENVEKIYKSKRKSKKPSFEETCDHCSRLFSNEARYEKHIKEQLCYSKDEITYCKLCDVTLPDRKKYNAHLYSLDHIKSIGFDSLDTIETNKIQPINYLDPYLNKDEVNKICTKNLGDGFTFVFNSGNTKTIALVNDTKSSSEKQNQPKQQISQQQQQPQQPLPVATDRQEKILKFLRTMTNAEEGNKKFDTILRKCTIEDYKYLQKLIANLEVDSTMKTGFLKIVDDFISEMVSRRNKGEKLYNSKDISSMVINLTL